MTENLLPTMRTSIGMGDFAKAILVAWPDATKDGAGVLWAQFAGETGDGQSCWNYNLGNVKHVRGDGHDYVALRGVWEGVTPDQAKTLIASGFWEADTSASHQAAVGPGKVSVVATGNNPATWFRAYPTLAAGMAEFLKSKQTVLLEDGSRAPDTSQPRWEPVWKFVLAGDPDGYARELGRLRYYTASPDAYASLMRAKFARWMSDAPWMPGAQPSTPPVANPDLVPGYVIDQAVEVELDGATWLVAPVVVAPIGIGQAADVARSLGCELPTPALVDAIWRAADLRVPPDLMIRQTDGVHMNTPELDDQEAQTVAAYVGPRSLGVDYTLLAGAFKDVVVIDGVPGLYGWHADADSARKLAARGMTLHPPATPGEGVVVQPPYTGHELGWIDYSQGLRLCRRKT